MKKSNKMIAVPLLIFVVLVSNVVFAMASQTGQTQSDVLIVQIGEDTVVDETSSIIYDSIKNQNEIKENRFKQQIKDLSIVQNLVSSSQQMSLEQLSLDYRPIRTNLIIISIEDLNNGILDKYESTALFVVSHGSEEGIMTEIDAMTWEALSEIIANEENVFNFIASCYSANMLDNLDNSYGIIGEIDNQYAAYMGLAYLFAAMGEKTIAENYYVEALIRSIEVQISPDQYNALGMIAIEYFAAFTNIAVWLLGLVVGSPVISKMAITIQKVIVSAYEALGTVRAAQGLITALEQVTNGQISVLTFFYQIARCLARLIVIAVKISQWYEKVFLAGATAIGSNAAIMVVKIGFALVMATLIVVRIVKDRNDNDSYARW